MKLRLILVLLLLAPMAAFAQYNFTDCTGTENPMSESGKWTNGVAAGGNLWGSVRKAGGICFGDTEPTAFGDPTAVLSQAWGSSQSAYAVVSGSTGSTFAEVELRLRSAITLNSISGYEINCSILPGNAYMQLVKWNGANGSFSYIARYLSSNVAASGNEPILCSPGDKFYADVSGPANATIFHVYKNGHLLQMTLENGTGNATNIPEGSTTAFTNGSPGMGFYDGGGSFAGWGFSYFAAGNRIALTPSNADVAAAATAASDGDVILIPEGSSTWTGSVVTTKQVALLGVRAPTLTATATDGTTITDGAGAATLITMTTGSVASAEIGNLRFLAGTGTGRYIDMKGSGSKVGKLHDVFFDIPNFQLTNAVLWESLGGVHWNFYYKSAVNGGTCGSQVGSDSGSLQVFSPKAWDAADTSGTLDTNGDQNLYLEDGVAENVGQWPDIDDNGRVVLRHVQMIGSWGEIHGTTGPQGGRWVEIYDSRLSYPNSLRPINWWFWWRGGSGVITNNTVDNAGGGGCYQISASWQFSAETTFANLGGHGCCVGYSCWHQPGSGTVNGITNACSATNPTSCLDPSQAPADTFQMLDPIYIWGNTGLGNVSTNYRDATFPNTCGRTTSAVVRSGTEYFTDGTAKPGWARFTYPHPIRGLAADTTPPSVTITNPTSGAVVSGIVTVSANCTDNVAVAGVTFQRINFQGTVNLGPEITIPPYSLAWDTTTANNLTYTLKATCRDTSNNLGTFQETVTVNNAGAIIPPAPLPIMSRLEK